MVGSWSNKTIEENQSYQLGFLACASWMRAWMSVQLYPSSQSVSVCPSRQRRNAQPSTYLFLSDRNGISGTPLMNLTIRTFIYMSRISCQEYRCTNELYSHSLISHSPPSRTLSSRLAQYSSFSSNSLPWQIYLSSRSPLNRKATIHSSSSASLPKRVGSSINSRSVAIILVDCLDLHLDLSELKQRDRNISCCFSSFVSWKPRRFWFGPDACSGVAKEYSLAKGLSGLALLWKCAMTSFPVLIRYFRILCEKQSKYSSSFPSDLSKRVALEVELTDVESGVLQTRM